MNAVIVCLLAAFIGTACTLGDKQVALHDFGVPGSSNENVLTASPEITVAAPEWLADNGIHYRLLYAEPTQIRTYAQHRWIAAPPELFKQQLLGSGKFQKYALMIRLLDFEQRFDRPDSARVVLGFSVEAYAGDGKRLIGRQLIRLEQAGIAPDVNGAVNGFAGLTRKAMDKIQAWLLHAGN